MPDWQPNWNDVVFDYGVAADAADACVTTAAALRGAVDERRRLAATTAVGWVGRARDSFDDQLAARASEAADLEQGLRLLAAAIRSAAEAARSEQVARDTARAEWVAQALADGTLAAPTATPPPGPSSGVTPVVVLSHGRGS